jgi:hypothetical protein
MILEFPSIEVEDRKEEMKFIRAYKDRLQKAVDLLTGLEERNRGFPVDEAFKLSSLVGNSINQIMELYAGI